MINWTANPLKWDSMFYLLLGFFPKASGSPGFLSKTLLYPATLPTRTMIAPLHLVYPHLLAKKLLTWMWKIYRGGALCSRSELLQMPSNLCLLFFLPPLHLCNMISKLAWETFLSFTPLKCEWLWDPQVLDFEGRGKTMISTLLFCVIHFHQTLGLWVLVGH